MVDVGRLRMILERVDRDLRRLRELSATPAEVLIDELNLLDAVKYRFVTVIEGLIDVAHHIIASEGLRAARTYADAFVVLGEAALLDHEVAATAADVARFRDLLVHTMRRSTTSGL